LPLAERSTVPLAERASLGLVALRLYVAAQPNTATRVATTPRRTENQTRPSLFSPSRTKSDQTGKLVWRMAKDMSATLCSVHGGPALRAPTGSPRRIMVARRRPYSSTAPGPGSGLEAVRAGTGRVRDSESPRLSLPSLLVSLLLAPGEPRTGRATPRGRPHTQTMQQRLLLLQNGKNCTN